MNQDFSTQGQPEDEVSSYHDLPVEAIAPLSPAATVVLKRSGAETEFKFPISHSAIIGRFDPAIGPIDIDLKDLPEGSYVSRRHAKLELVDNHWMISDLGSSNGTWTLGEDGSQFQKVTDAKLADGAEFALGNARFVLHFANDAPEPNLDHSSANSSAPEAEPVHEEEFVHAPEPISEPS